MCFDFSVLLVVVDFRVALLLVAFALCLCCLLCRCDVWRCCVGCVYGYCFVTFWCFCVHCFDVVLLCWSALIGVVSLCVGCDCVVCVVLRFIVVALVD